MLKTKKWKNKEKIKIMKNTQFVFHFLKISDIYFTAKII